MTLIPSIGLMLALALVGPSGDGNDGGKPPAAADWRFVLPGAGDPFEHGPFRALALRREKPEDLLEKVNYRGEPARRRYAQIRFGSAASIRVTVVLDETASGEVDLYVDADRNRRIDDRDRVATASAAPGERVWRRPLDVAIVDRDVTTRVPRAVVFRRGAGGRTLGFASAGYLEGTVMLEETGKPRRVAARRVDGDGNGLLADSQDRLWLDLNGDGRFDPASEPFLFANVLELGGQRYAVRSDELGRRLGLEAIAGTGSLRLAWKPADDGKGGRPGASSPREVRATALGRDGSVYSLSSTEPTIVPTGEYRLGTVMVSLDDPSGGKPWSFVFSDYGAKGDPRWYRVGKDATVTIDPVGRLAFEVDPGNIAANPPKAGQELALQPLIYTGDGLLIVVAYRGSPASPAAQDNLAASLAVHGGISVGAGEHLLATARSGFA
ncbi:MAG: hypothetical protein ACYC61_10600 [Isosphaeraceae bacterium]